MTLLLKAFHLVAVLLALTVASAGDGAKTSPSHSSNPSQIEPDRATEAQIPCLHCWPDSAAQFFPQGEGLLFRSEARPHEPSVSDAIRDLLRAE